jgi:hypothetical protein
VGKFFSSWNRFLQIPVEVAVCREDQHGILIYAVFVRFDGSRECIELGVPVKGVTVDPCGLRIGLALNLLHLPVGHGADLAEVLFHGPQDLRTSALSL